MPWPRWHRSQRCAPPDAARARALHEASSPSSHRRRTGPCRRRSGDPRAPGDWRRRNASGAVSYSSLARLWYVLGRIGERQPLRGERDSFDDLAVAGTTADVSRNGFDDVLAGRLRIVAQQRRRGQHHAGRAITALQAVHFAERVLDDAELAGSGRDAFDRRDLVTVSLHGKHQAGARRFAVEQNRAGAADAVLAAGMRAGETEILAQTIEQGLPRLDIGAAALAVDG